MIDPSRIPSVDVVEAERMTRPDAGADEAGASGATADKRPNALLVDVREPNEFFAIRAPHAALLPLSQFIARYQELPRDRPVVMICQAGNRSAQATAYLLAQGWIDVRNVTGGMNAWQRAGLEVRTGPVAPGEGELPERPGARRP